MSFVAAMNSAPLTKEGVKGSVVYTEEGVGDLRTSLFQMIVRSLEESEIRRVIHQAFHSGRDKQYVMDFAVMAFQTRDIRGGKGERDVAYKMLLAIMYERHDLIEPLLRLIPEYGCWRDMWQLLKLVEKSSYEKLLAAVINVTKWIFFEDLAKLDKGYNTDLSLLGKWLPREGSTNDTIAKLLAGAFFPETTDENDRMKMYRKACVRLGRAISVVEQKMCGGKWREIVPANVPGRLMNKARKAFLNEVRGHKNKDGPEIPLRFPDNGDRMECRQNFLNHLEQVLAGKASINGANVVFPHEIVAKFLYTNGNRFSKADESLLQAQWDAIRNHTKQQGGLRGIVPMSDFSGSMNGIAMQVSLALGILLSEINHPAFADYLLGFDSEPSWISFKGMTHLSQKINYARKFAQGTSTNFEEACDLILRRLVEHNVPREEAPRDLLVLTDMGFDQACFSTSWKTHFQMIQANFAAAGYDAPRIVVWNLRAEYKDYYAQAHEDGVVVLSGWSPAVLKAIQKDGIEVRTPYDGLRELLDDARYDLVRSALDGLL